MRIAFSTEDWKGLEDCISEVFAKADTFTIIEYDLKQNKIKNIEIIDNDAKTFSHGAGPIAIKILLDKNVKYVCLPEVGVGSEKLLREKGLKYIKVSPGTKVREALKIVLDNLT